MFTPRQQYLLDLIDAYAREQALLTAFLALIEWEEYPDEVSAENRRKKAHMEGSRDRARADLEIAIKMI